MNRAMYADQSVVSVMRGRTASRARTSWHMVFAAHGRPAGAEHDHARIAERHAWGERGCPSNGGFTVEPPPHDGDFTLHKLIARR